MRGYKTQGTRVEITGSKYEGGQLLVSGKGLAGQKFENLPWHDPLGFHSRPKKGDVAYLHSPGGNGDMAIVTAAFEAGKVPELQEGERAMYDGGSNVVKLTTDGWEFNAKVKITGDLEITGSFSAGGGISLDGDINAGGNGTFGGVVTDSNGDGGRVMRIIPIGDAARPNLAPDIVLDGLVGDFAPAEAGEPKNRGGLRAKAQLRTAVIIALMTDARADADELRLDDVNRGWPGDSFDLDLAAGEAPIGSKLWLLRRSAVIEGVTDRLAERYAEDALQPLVQQGAAAAVSASATAHPGRNRLDLNVELTDRAGASLVAVRFQLLWDAI